MPKLPSIRGKEFIKFLSFLGFQPVRRKGSHVRLKHGDGRATMVLLHGNNVIPKGLFKKNNP